MKKITSKQHTNSLVVSSSYLMIPASFIDKVVGKVLTHIEMMGLPLAQEKAAKDMIKQDIWNLTSQKKIPSGLVDCMYDLFQKQSNDEDYMEITSNPILSDEERKIFYEVICTIED